MEELDIKELFNMFWTRKEKIVIIVLISAILGGIYSFVFVKPTYKAYTKLVLAKSEDVASSDTITTTDISINQKLVSTYSELIKTKSVLRKVIDNLEIQESEEDLKKAISVTAVSDTQLIQINVINKDPKTAQIIANEIAKVFITKVEDIYKINNVHVVDEAELPEKPNNINHIKDIAISALVGIVIAGMYVIIANMLDTTVKTQEDVEKKLGLTVLVNIPINNFDEIQKTGKGGKK